MLFSRTFIFVLLVSFSSVMTYDFDKYTTFGYQIMELAEKPDTRRRNDPQKGDTNAKDSDKKGNRKGGKDKKNEYSA
ncbi:hypothetical protein QUF50_06290 [Thiotrichales bacterium HSG1]|nr:hypothetical protein [Thiotrichales bacterium HSG1]